MADLFLSMTLASWALAVCFVAALMLSAWYEQTAIALLAVAGYVIALWFLTATDPFALAAENPGTTILMLAAYAIVGAAWSLFKWDRWMASAKVQAVICEARKAYHKRTQDDALRNLPSPPFLESYGFPNIAKPAENKDRIVNWIALWPLSFAGYFIGEFMVRIWTRIYQALASTYDAITKRHVGE